MSCDNVKKFARSRAVIKRSESNLFKQMLVAMLPAYFNHSPYITLHAITGSIIVLRNIRIEILADKQEVVVVRKTKFCSVY